MGIERLMELVKVPEQKREGFYIAALCEEALDAVYKVVIEKRKNDKVVTQYEAKSLKNHLKQADKSEVRYFACIGEDELKNNTIWVKDLESKEEKIINIADF